MLQDIQEKDFKFCCLVWLLQQLILDIHILQLYYLATAIAYPRYPYTSTLLSGYCNSLSQISIYFNSIIWLLQQLILDIHILQLYYLATATAYPRYPYTSTVLSGYCNSLSQISIYFNSIIWLLQQLILDIHILQLYYLATAIAYPRYPYTSTVLSGYCNSLSQISIYFNSIIWLLQQLILDIHILQLYYLATATAYPRYPYTSTVLSCYCNSLSQISIYFNSIIWLLQQLILDIHILQLYYLATAMAYPRYPYTSTVLSGYCNSLSQISIYFNCIILLQQQLILDIHILQLYYLATAIAYPRYPYTSTVLSCYSNSLSQISIYFNCIIWLLQQLILDIHILQLYYLATAIAYPRYPYTSTVLSGYCNSLSQISIYFNSIIWLLQQLILDIHILQLYYLATAIAYPRYPYTSTVLSGYCNSLSQISIYFNCIIWLLQQLILDIHILQLYYLAIATAYPRYPYTSTLLSGYCNSLSQISIYFNCIIWLLQQLILDIHILQLYYLATATAYPRYPYTSTVLSGYCNSLSQISIYFNCIIWLLQQLILDIHILQLYYLATATAYPRYPYTSTVLSGYCNSLSQISIYFNSIIWLLQQLILDIHILQLYYLATAIAYPRYPYTSTVLSGYCNSLSQISIYFNSIIWLLQQLILDIHILQLYYLATATAYPRYPYTSTVLSGYCNSLSQISIYFNCIILLQQQLILDIHILQLYYLATAIAYPRYPYTSTVLSGYCNSLSQISIYFNCIIWLLQQLILDIHILQLYYLATATAYPRYPYTSTVLSGYCNSLSQISIYFNCIIWLLQQLILDIHILQLYYLATAIAYPRYPYTSTLLSGYCNSLSQISIYFNCIIWLLQQLILDIHILQLYYLATATAYPRYPYTSTVLSGYCNSLSQISIYFNCIIWLLQQLILDIHILQLYYLAIATAYPRYPYTSTLLSPYCNSLSQISIYFNCIIWLLQQLILDIHILQLYYLPTAIAYPRYPYTSTLLSGYCNSLSQISIYFNSIISLLQQLILDIHILQLYYLATATAYPRYPYTSTVLSGYCNSLSQISIYFNCIIWLLQQLILDIHILQLYYLATATAYPRYPYTSTVLSGYCNSLSQISIYFNCIILLLQQLILDIHILQLYYLATAIAYPRYPYTSTLLSGYCNSLSQISIYFNCIIWLLQQLILDIHILQLYYLATAMAYPRYPYTSTVLSGYCNSLSQISIYFNCIILLLQQLILDIHILQLYYLATAIAYPRYPYTSTVLSCYCNSLSQISIYFNCIILLLQQLILDIHILQLYYCYCNSLSQISIYFNCIIWLLQQLILDIHILQLYYLATAIAYPRYPYTSTVLSCYCNSLSQISIYFNSIIWLLQQLILDIHILQLYYLATATAYPRYPYTSTVLSGYCNSLSQISIYFNCIILLLQQLILDIHILQLYYLATATAYPRYPYTSTVLSGYCNSLSQISIYFNCIIWLLQQLILDIHILQLYYLATATAYPRYPYTSTVLSCYCNSLSQISIYFNCIIWLLQQLILDIHILQLYYLATAIAYPRYPYTSTLLSPYCNSLSQISIYFNCIIWLLQQLILDIHILQLYYLATATAYPRYPYTSTVLSGYCNSLSQISIYFKCIIWLLQQLILDIHILQLYYLATAMAYHRNLYA